MKDKITARLVTDENSTATGKMWLTIDREDGDNSVYPVQEEELGAIYMAFDKTYGELDELVEKYEKLSQLHIKALLKHHQDTAMALLKLIDKV